MSSPFISDGIDLIEERILLIPNEDFITAQFFVEYHFEVKQAGTQIPMLFYTSKIKGDFKFWIDATETKLDTVGKQYEDLAGTPFEGFDYIYEDKYWSDSKHIHLEQTNSRITSIDIKDLLFSKTDLAIGKHIAKVQFTADHWESYSEWVVQKSFHYILDPTKKRNPFGRLNITVDCSNCKETTTSNLGMPSNGKLTQEATWELDSLPQEIFILSHKSPIPPFAQLLINISPKGIAFIFALLFTLIHVIILKKRQKKFH